MYSQGGRKSNAAVFYAASTPVFAFDAYLSLGLCLAFDRPGLWFVVADS